MSEKPDKNDMKKPQPVWRKALCVIGWTIAAVIVLVIAAITVAVNYLKPERLTPLVEKIANENIRGHLSLDRVEISFYSTFPRFELDMKGLTLTTDAFKSLPDSVARELPVYSDTLIRVGSFNGAINIPKLLAGKIHIYDTTIDSPQANLVQATPDAWSLDIFPPSAEDDDKDEAPLHLPDIELGKFEITGGFPIRYVSIPDSINARIALSTTSLSGQNAPSYKLVMTGLTSASIPDMTIRDLGIGIGGDIVWNASTPLRLSLEDFMLRAGKVTTNITSTIDLENELLIESLKASLPETPLADIIALVPDAYRGELDKVDANFAIATSVSLTRPYMVGKDSIPSFDLSVKIPEGSVKYDGLSLDILELEASASVDGNNLDNSQIDIKHLKAQGEGMGFVLEAKASDLISDPYVSGNFRGGLSFAHLPKIVLKEISGTITGLLKADCDFDLRRSWISKEEFHRVKLKGDATLSKFNIDMPEIPFALYTREAELKLGTNSSFTRMDETADSLLTASLKIDTAACQLPGMELRGRGLKMGIGTKNSAASSDTTVINPIGGRITAQWIMLKSEEDSMRVRLHNATVGASVTRYKGESRKPLMHLDIGAEHALYGDRLNRAMLERTGMVLNIHPSAPPKLSKRRRERLDSIMSTHPEISEDSARRVEARMNYELKRARMSAALAADTTGHELVDMEIDNSMKKLLLLWQAEGRLKAERMRLFTPLFPLRNRLSDLDVRFNSDSLTVTNTQINVGNSDFIVNGSVGNITRALTSSTGRQSLKANFNLVSDTIDINQIAGAVFAGAAFAEKDDGLLSLKTDDANADEEKLEQTVAMAAADTTSVLVIPYNIEANLDVSAKNIIYSNLTFHDFRGILNLYRGALNLSSLTARTDVGAVGLNALYSAPSKHDVSFAFGLNVSDFRIGEFLKLVPAIDTVMPLLQSVDGIINAEIAATTDIDSVMNIDIPSLKAAVKISGDSLKVTDDETFRKIGKWLLFKHKERNIIDSMNVEMIVENSTMQMFPFMFNLDRYKLGVMGSNDMNMNFKYHIAVLKSPIPFKFGINVSGNPDKMKIRLGGAKFNEKNISKTVSIADTTRINLVNEIRNVFRRGVRNARVKSLNFSGAGQPGVLPDMPDDTISHADSLYFIKEGLIAAPDTTGTTLPASSSSKKTKNK